MKPLHLTLFSFAFFASFSQAQTPLTEEAAQPSAKVSMFAPPVRLMVNDEPLNTVAQLRFPSPALYDIDNDGQEELVVGSLMGQISVYENTNTTGKGDPIWGSSKSIKDSSGKLMRSKNW